MLTVRKSSVFQASKEKVYIKLQKLKTLQYIAYPYATFEPLNREKDLIIMSIISGFFILVFIIPNFEMIFESNGINPPLLTKILIKL